MWDFKEHYDWIETVCFSPKDKYICAGSINISIWRLEDGVLVNLIRGYYEILDIKFFPENEE